MLLRISLTGSFLALVIIYQRCDAGHNLIKMSFMSPQLVRISHHKKINIRFVLVAETELRMLRECLWFVWCHSTQHGTSLWNIYANFIIMLLCTSASHNFCVE